MFPRLSRVPGLHESPGMNAAECCCLELKIETRKENDNVQVLSNCTVNRIATAMNMQERKC